jgi:hypothetical protein
MMVYRITWADGFTFTAEGNEAFALAEVAKGHRVEVVGLSRISRRVRAVARARELSALDAAGGFPLLTYEQERELSGLVAEWGIDDHELR